MSARKLKAWTEAGLIDADTAERIAAFEAEHSRPIALWAVIGIAALSIGLGFVSVVAANWDDIPAMVRLGVHFALLAGGALALGLRGDDLATRHPWFHEAALFVFAMLGLTFFGHIGQAYQTSSPLWKPFAGWLALFAPLLLLRGRSWLTAATLMVILVWACWDYGARDQAYGTTLPLTEQVRLAMIVGLPVLAAPIAAWQRGLGGRTDFWRRLRQMAVGYGVVGASMAAIGAGFDDYDGTRGLWPMQASIWTWSLIALAAATGVALLRKTAGGRATSAVLAASSIAGLLALLVSGNQVPAALVFMALWAALAWASLGGGWRHLFQLAVAVIALRLIVLSFELNDDLLASGFGLILSGLLTLGVAWAALKVSRQFAPKAREDSE